MATSTNEIGNASLGIFLLHPIVTETPFLPKIPFS